MRSQVHRHPTRRPTSLVIAREHRPNYRPEHHDAVAGTVDEAVAAINADQDGPPVPVPEGELAELVATLRAADRLTARAVRLAGELDARRVAAEEGMTCDGALRLHTGLVGRDVAMVLTAADVLASMPAVAGLFARGVLSWGHVRQLTTGVRRLDAATRTALDGHLGEHAGRLEALDPERRAWAIEDAVDDHRPERTLERRADRQDREPSSWLCRASSTGPAACTASSDRRASRPSSAGSKPKPTHRRPPRAPATGTDLTGRPRPVAGSWPTRWSASAPARLVQTGASDRRCACR